MICSAKSLQISKCPETGQEVFRFWFNRFVPTLTGVLPAAITGVTNGNDILVVGVPATPADVSILTMPPGISGRMLRFGVKFDLLAFESNAWAGGDTEGTILCDRIAEGGAALATVATLVLPQAAPALGGAGVINDAEYTDVAVFPAGGAAPGAYAGGDCFYAYTSVARVIAAGGVQGKYTPFLDVTIDQIAAEADATVLTYLYAQ